jgi:hypothetical protein
LTHCDLFKKSVTSLAFVCFESSTQSRTNLSQTHPRAANVSCKSPTDRIRRRGARNTLDPLEPPADDRHLRGWRLCGDDEPSDSVAVRSDPVCEEGDPGNEVSEVPDGDPVEDVPADEESHDDASEIADERRLRDEQRDEGVLMNGMIDQGILTPKISKPEPSAEKMAISPHTTPE